MHGINLRIQWALIGIISFLILRSIVGTFPNGNGLPDFGDFYCAGATQNAGGRPYTSADLDRCGNVAERPVNASSFAGHRPPAPIPGYDVAFFRVVALFPYERASYVWLVSSTLGLLVAVYCISNVAGIPPLLVFAALAFPVFRACLYWGQLAALVFAFISIAAYEVRHKRYRWAALAAAGTLIEPHIGVPTCLAMACWIPQTRYVILLVFGALGAISFATLGYAANLAYVQTILPLHVRAEVPFMAQFSLAWLLYVVGVHEAIALRVAEVSYYVTFAFAIYVTRGMQKLYIPIVPAALVVLGGPFIHINQVEIALVAALVYAGRNDSPRAWSAVVLLSVIWFATPWLSHQGLGGLFGCAVVVALITAYALRTYAPARRWSTTAAAFGAYIVYTVVILRMHGIVLRAPDLVAYEATLIGLEQYASAPWGIRLHGPAEASTLLDLLWKLPTWIALGLIAWQSWAYRNSALEETERGDAVARLEIPVKGKLREVAS